MSRADDGFATVWAAGVITALMTLATVITYLGAAVITRHRAESAADLAALAGAAHAVSGEAVACERARWVASRMGGELVVCVQRQWNVAVQVAVRPPGLIGDFGSALASAAAGPVE
jgi:secretion/DNA translocation related TadE-like protein